MKYFLKPLLWSLVFLFLGASSCRMANNKVEAPIEAYETLDYIIKYNKAPDGYVGGRKFGNFEELLPKKTEQGKKIFYKEWDIYPKKKGINRGPHRLVTGNNRTAFYTPDHYQSFIEIFPKENK
ncbi:ribonuclease [Spirosomataceae bacterium TFI 002]|nr:ribonuclease [Spirosomataceae bacterium TFI 002]